MTTKELQTIKDADPKKVPFNEGIFKEMQRYIGEKTDGFKNVSGLESKKIDMTADIENAGKSVEDFKKKYGSTSYSEQDIASYLAGAIDGKITPPKDENPPIPQPSDDADKAAAKAKRKRLFAFKVKVATATK